MANEFVAKKGLLSTKIGAGVTVNVASAIIQADSTTQGFLPPRVTTAQMNAISSPAVGLMVFNTDTLTIQVYNGSVWYDPQGQMAVSANLFNYYNFT